MHLTSEPRILDFNCYFVSVVRDGAVDLCEGGGGDGRGGEGGVQLVPGDAEVLLLGSGGVRVGFELCNSTHKDTFFLPARTNKYISFL